jgi:hypothetical protein
MTDDRLHTRRCECGALDCTAEIEATWEEDDAVDHSGENLWIVATGHQLLGAREAVVVSANERFSVVRAVEECPQGFRPSSRATTARRSSGNHAPAAMASRALIRSGRRWGAGLRRHGVLHRLGDRLNHGGRVLHGLGDRLDHRRCGERQDPSGEPHRP